MAAMLLFGVLFVTLLQCVEAQQLNCQCNANYTALIRLVNGGTNAQGNVEVRLNTTSPWGTVCGRGWDFRDATVVCRQLGFAKALAATVQSSFGTGSGRIWLDDVRCSGIENRITECPRSAWGRVNGYCRQHLSHYPYQGVAGVVCAVNQDDDIDLRLVGGANEGIGQVQVGFRGAWGYVCNTNWDRHDAAVVCRQLGYQGVIVPTIGSAFWSGPTNRIWLRNVRCFGEENSLKNCPHDLWGSTSSSSCGLAGVVCDDGGHNNMTIRLVGGLTGSSGRVEIGFNNTWGTVCDNNWDIYDALVVCRMLGYPTAVAATLRSSFSHGTGRIWLDDVACTGAEESLHKCSHSGWGVYSSSCSHSRDSGVFCGETMQVEVRLRGGVNQSHGRVEFGLDGAWGTVCDNNWDIHDARVVCRMLGYPTAVAATLRSSFTRGIGRMWLDNVGCTGTEEHIGLCLHGGWGVYSSSCSHSREAGVICGETMQVEVRLRGGVNQSHGRVEIGAGGAWGTVCDNNWDIHDAHVVCHMLGYPTAVAATLRSSFTRGIGRMWLDNVGCTGTEEHIGLCLHGGWGVYSSSCSHSREAGVLCGETMQVEARLRGGVNQSHGRVEIGVSGAWGTICDDNWDIHDARVLCRMLGYPTAVAATLRSSFTRGIGRMWLDNVRCTGTEEHIGLCSHYGWGVYRSFCSHDREAGVICGELNSHIDVRLVGGVDQSYGRIEIGLNGVWGTVCGTTIDIRDATVVCRQLGYGKAFLVARYPYFSLGTGRIWLEGMDCRGDELHIGDCHNNRWGLTSCDHSTDGGIFCGNHNETIEVRLVDGVPNMIGRVEIGFHGVWGTVCDANWDIHDAHVVCRQLGYGKALVATINSAFGKGVGTVWGDVLNCRGEETRIEDCTIGMPSAGGSCLNHAEDVGVVCTDEPSIRLVGGNGFSNGRVEIGFERQFWGGICHTDWSYEDATVLCKMLDFERGLPTFSSTFGSGVHRSWLSSVNCIGEEKSILDCVKSGWNVPCSPSNHAGVICLGPSYTPEIRLVGGNDVSYGFVEIGFNDTWGRVCSTNWDLSDARVICRMLGYQYALAATGGNTFGRSLANRYWITDVNCRGNELTITDCPLTGWGTSCGSNIPAGVVCTDTIPKIDIHLVGGKDESQGRVELSLNGVWGTVCHESWDIHDAEVVCRQLGYSGAIAATLRGSASFAAGTGRIWATNFACKGEEQSLLDCGHSVWGVHSCDHSSDAGVVCRTGNVTDIDIELEKVEGDSIGQGRVLVGLNGAWGAICPYEWDLNDAHVVCRQLGFANAIRTMNSAKYGRWTGRIWLRGLRCTGSEDSLLDCTHNGWGIQDYYRYYWHCDRNRLAGVTCNDEIPLEELVTVSSLPERIISGPGSTVNMTCTFHGVDLRNFAVKWSINGTVLESQPSSIKSHFTLFAIDNSSVLQIRRGSPHLSGDYKCFFQNHPSISSNSNVTFTPGCPAAPLRAESGVGHSVTLPCSRVHASFNPEGWVKWTCTENQQWEGDLSSCTFHAQTKEILILSAVFNKSLANYDNNVLLEQTNSQLNSALQTSLENLTVSNKRILTDYDTTVVHIVTEMESSLTLQTRSRLMRLETLHLTFADATKITANIDEKVILKPSDKCRCPAKVTSTSRALVTLEVCNAPYYVRSPCKCEINGTCSCSGVYTQIEGLCWLDTDGDGIPNSTPDPCEGCCLPSFDRGFQWPRTSHGLEVSYPCSDLSPLLSAFSRIRRRCNANGHWGDIALSGCTFGSTTEQSVLFIEVNVTLSVNALKNMEDDLFSKLSDAASPHNLGEFRVIRYFPTSESVTSISLSVDVQRDVIADSISALESTRDGIFINPPVVFGFKPSVYCHCPNEALSIENKLLTLCIGPGSTPCDCEGSAGHCVCSDPYINIVVEGENHCSLDTDGDSIPDFQDVNPTLYDGDKSSRGCVAASPSTGDCPGLTESGILWPSTPPCDYSIQRCTRKSDNATAFNIGLAKRFCNSSGMWETANVTDCESKAFREARVIIDELRESTLNTPVAIEGGIKPVEEDQVALFTSTTFSLTSEAKRLADNSESLFPRDLGTAVTYVDTVSEASVRTDLFKQDRQQGMEIFNLVDNILDSQHMQAWNLLKSMGSNGAPNLLQNSEELASSITHNLQHQSNNVSTFREIKTVNLTLNNIVVNGGILEVKSEFLSNGLIFTGSADQETTRMPSIRIPKGLLNERSDGGTVQVVNMQIKGLSELLQTGVNKTNQTTLRDVEIGQHSCEGMYDCHLGSTILSSQVGLTNFDSQTPLEEPVEITFPMESSVKNAKCVFWKFQSDSDDENSQTGQWSNEGLTTVIEKDTVLCKSTHLTSFAVLVDVSGSTNQYSPEHLLALSIATYIGCSISLFALVFTIVYFISLRKQLITQIGNFVHLNLCLALAFGLVIFLVGSQTAVSSLIACKLVTTLLHYFFLSLFFWMLCEGIHLFRMTVIVFHINKRKWLLYYSITGWILPAIITAISVAAKHNLYRIPASYDKGNPNYHKIRACWLPIEDGVIAAFIAPMLFVLLVNAVIIVIALRKIYVNRRLQKSENSDSDMKTNAIKAMQLLKSIAILLPLTGLTWIFGLLAVNPITSFFSWVFLILNTLQGVFIFICLVVRHDEFRAKFKKFCHTKGRKAKQSSDTDAAYTKASGESTLILSSTLPKEKKTSHDETKKATNVYEVAYHSAHGQGVEDDPDGEDKVSICSEGDEKHQLQQETQ